MSGSIERSCSDIPPTGEATPSEGCGGARAPPPKEDRQGTLRSRGRFHGRGYTRNVKSILVKWVTLPSLKTLGYTKGDRTPTGRGDPSRATPWQPSPRSCAQALQTQGPTRTPVHPVPRRSHFGADLALRLGVTRRVYWLAHSWGTKIDTGKCEGRRERERRNSQRFKTSS
jgi:hypothetical protein